ncbi:MAG: thioesterase domain-containing protein, partial [Acidobacteriota bacterium]
LAREDAPGDRRLVAYVVPVEAGHQASSNGALPAELKSALQRTLPDYMVPSHFVVIDAFPLTPNGKIDRGGLAAPDRSLRPLTQSRVAPRDEVEKQLSAIWEKVLGIDGVGVDDNFFELGGHSLLAVRLMSEIEKAVGQKIPLVSLFQTATISALAAILRRGVSAISWPTVVEIQPGSAQPPLFCVSPPNVNALGYRSLARYLGEDQRVYGLQAQYPEDLNGEYSQAVVDELVSEYLEAMRAVQPNGPYQLLGQCRGAHIAFEMARRLNAQGEQTAFLGILDTWVMENTLNSLWYFKYSLSKLASQGRKSLANGMALIKARHSARRSPAPKRDPVPEVYFPGPGFVPKTYAGRLAVFRARKQPRYRVRDKTLGWGTLVPGGVEVYVIPGTHSNVLSEPHVGWLAAALKKCLLPSPSPDPSPSPVEARRD